MAAGVHAHLLRPGLGTMWGAQVQCLVLVEQQRRQMHVCAIGFRDYLTAEPPFPLSFPSSEQRQILHPLVSTFR